MAGLDFGISYSGLSAAQKAIQVTQNNISNMNTEGYARQQLILTAQNILSGNGVEKSIGTGVISEKIERIMDEYLINQARQEKANVGYYNQKEINLTTIENYFNDNSDGSLTKIMTEYFNAWEEASKFPEEVSYRAAIIAKAEMFVNKITQLNSDLKSMAGQVETDMRIQINEVNLLTEKIKNVNERIATAGTDEPNSLYDERDGYLDRLSELVDVKTIKDENNPRVINLEIGGTTVLTGDEMQKLELKMEASEQEWIVTSGNRIVEVDNGKLAASINFRNNELAKYTEMVDEMVKGIIQETNSIHENGYNMFNETGISFFEGSSITTIKLNEELIKNPQKISLSGKMDTVGNSDIAKQMHDLATKNTMLGNTTSYIAYYNGLVVEMASELNTVKNNHMIHQAMSNNVENSRQSIQGVNLDEELGNLMKFQQYYAANSKVVNVINEMYDTLLSVI